MLTKCDLDHTWFTTTLTGYWLVALIPLASIQPGNMPNSVPTNRTPDTEHAENVRLLRSAMLVGWECLFESAGP
jgi:hypothetical protein